MNICEVSKAVGKEGTVLTAAIIPGRNFGKQCKMVTSHRKVITIREVTENMAGEITVIMAATTAAGHGGILREAIMEDIMAEDMVDMEDTADHLPGHSPS